MTERPTPPVYGEAPPVNYRVTLKAGRERSLLRRHPWVYSGAVELLEGHSEARPGDLGQVVSAGGELLGIASVNPAAALVARVLRFDGGPVDRDWMIASLRRAAALREQFVPERTNAYRLVNAEGDGLPGLIVDRYADWLVVQCLTAGMARLEPLWLAALAELMRPRGIAEKSARARRDINLTREDGLLWGEPPTEPLEVEEAGQRFLVNVTVGQKTGFYLDQRESRRLVGGLARGKRVLDAFAYTGGFSVWAGAGGAREVVAVETSGAARVMARENWRLNGLPEDSLELVAGAAQRFLRNDSRRHDIIILDPPAYARDRGHRDRAARAYKDINLWAMRRLAAGGYLVTFSCSQHIGVELFQKIIFGAALDAGVPLQWLARLGAGGDHPVHLDHPQGEYLTGLLLRSLDGE